MGSDEDASSANAPGSAAPLIQGVLFDLDGTLYDRAPVFAAWARWFATDRLKLRQEHDIAATVARLVALDGGGYCPKPAMFATIAGWYPELATPVADQVTAFREELVQHLPPLDPGATALLAALDASAIPWGIVTNGAATQLNKVRRLGLADRARCLLISEVCGFRKPDPAIFALAANRLGVEPARILFAGDNPVADITVAAAARMRTAWLRQGRCWPATLAGHEPDLVLETLSEPLDVLSPGQGSPGSGARR